MFTFAEDGMVWWPVDLVQFDADGDEPTKPAPVLLLFKRYTRSDLKSRKRKLAGAIAKLRTAPKDDDAALAAILREIEDQQDVSEDDLLERVRGWKKIKGANGEDLPFSVDVLRALLADDAQYKPIAAGLLEASRGARAKNSSPGPAGTRAPGQS